jgi:hypothetical protein
VYAIVVNTEPRPKPQIMILEKMKQLRDERKYCDLFIDVKGMRFIAHKSLVAAWSPYFDEALTNTNYVEKDLLIIHYDSYEVFSDLLEFFYTGNILPRETNFLQLLHLAVSFKIDLLKSYCEEFLRCNLHLGNCVSTYFLSRKYSLESLEEFIVGFLQSNLSDTVKQSEFLQMKAGKFHALLSKGSMPEKLSLYGPRDIPELNKVCSRRYKLDSCVVKKFSVRLISRRKSDATDDQSMCFNNKTKYFSRA